MVEANLQGCRVLVVEDEYLLADDISHALAKAGAEVLGPFPSVEEATSFISSGVGIDAAVLDVNLRGDMIFPVADALAKRGIPFAFATGYDRWALPERFTSAPRIEKPFQASKIATALAPILNEANN
jgi:DNA-binding NtrC family response regulator